MKFTSRMSPCWVRIAPHVSGANVTFTCSVSLDPVPTCERRQVSRPRLVLARPKFGPSHVCESLRLRSSLCPPANEDNLLTKTTARTKTTLRTKIPLRTKKTSDSPASSRSSLYPPAIFMERKFQIRTFFMAQILKQGPVKLQKTVVNVFSFKSTARAIPT